MVVTSETLTVCRDLHKVRASCATEGLASTFLIVLTFWISQLAVIIKLLQGRYNINFGISIHTVRSILYKRWATYLPDDFKKSCRVDKGEKMRDASCHVHINVTGHSQVIWSWTWFWQHRRLHLLTDHPGECLRSFVSFSFHGTWLLVVPMEHGLWLLVGPTLHPKFDSLSLGFSFTLIMEHVDLQFW